MLRKLPLSLFVSHLILSATLIKAQIANVNGETATPTPGVGHDYVKMLNETVDPASGALSLRLETPTPPGRQMALPFSFNYDSSGIEFIQQNPFPPYTGGLWGGNSGAFITGAWSLGLPSLSRIGSAETVPRQPDGSTTCEATTSYIFSDALGTRHDLAVSHIYYSHTALGQLSDACKLANMAEYDTGGDDAYQAILAGASATGNQAEVPSEGNPTVVDPDGTVYKFATPSWYCSAYSDQPIQSGLPTSITDRNGNYIAIKNGNGTNSCISFTATDTLGRTVLSTNNYSYSSNNGTQTTVSVAGLSQPYTLNWASASAAGWSYSWQNLTGDSHCNKPPNGGASSWVVTSISLPNGQQYKFSYDAAHALLSKVTFPSGGYVSYTWGNNPQSSKADYSDTNGLTGGCTAIYDRPAVLHRYVSFDGSTVALQQDFSYATTWSNNSYAFVTKTTTITTHDLVRGTSFQTVYAYLPGSGNVSPNIPGVSRISFPLESTVSYYDTNNHLLKTVTKGWSGTPFQLACQLTTLDNGLTSGVFYTYGTGGQLADKKEYDYGLITSASVCKNWASPPTGITPTRETATTYQNFAATSIYPYAPSIFDRPSSVIVKDSTGTPVAETDYAYDQTSVAPVSPAAVGHTSGINFGNLTSETAKCFQVGCMNAIKTYAYDETGQVISRVDANGNAAGSPWGPPSQHTTTYSYADAYSIGTPPGNTNAFLTTVTHPTVNGVTTHQYFQYSYADGQLTTAQDDNDKNNGTNTAYHYNDSLGRLTESDYADGGQTLISYNDAPPTPIVTTSQKLNTGGQYITHTKVMDGVGHLTQTQYTIPNGTIFIGASYDGLGRTYTTSNPYQSTSDPTYGMKTQYFDALGRATSVTDPDGSTVSYSYSGNCVTVTDQASKNRQTCTDGLGRVSKVIENPGGLAYETDYQYNPFDQITSVVQNGSRQRTFVYDSLGRISSSLNPEANTAPSNGATQATTYGYDANGNIISKTVPAPNQQATSTVTITYRYDPLNRLTQKSYSDGVTLPAQFGYDSSAVTMGSQQVPVANGIGRLTWTCVLHQSNPSCPTMTATSYDLVGRVAQLWQTNSTNNVNLETVYGYDLAGNLTSSTNGNGVTFSYSYDSAGRASGLTSSLSDSQHPATPATIDSSVGYYPNGALRKVTFGNGLTETAAYNKRFQPCRINVNSASQYLSTCTDVVPSGNVQDFNYGYNAGTSDNGDVASWSGSGNQNFNRSYTYDALDRLATMTAPGDGCSGLSWSYDPWGNRTAQTPTGGTCLSWSQTFDAQNRIIGFTHDTAGNVINDGTHNYTFDPENHLISVDSGTTATYAYDADGRRVSRTASGATTTYLYDPAGRIVADIQGTNWMTSYIYLGGRLLGEYSNGTTYFTHQDHLGSTRLLTGIPSGSNPAPVIDSVDYLPFGEQISGDTHTTHKFTGKERDSETSLDNFGARYYSSSAGRFMSPDNFLNDTKAIEPASWNLYSYVHDNPLRFTDPSGEKIYVGGICPPDSLDKCGALIHQLDFVFKCTNCVSVSADGYLVVDTSQIGPEVRQATQYLVDAIQSETTYFVVQISNNDPNVAFGENRGAGHVGAPVKGLKKGRSAMLIVLDLDDFNAIGGDEEAKEAFVNTVLAHEIAHYYRGEDAKVELLTDPSGGGDTGPVVDFVNKITDALGLPRRAEYSSRKSGDDFLSIRFEKKVVGKNGQEKTKDVYIQWMKRNVGGKGAD